MIKILEQGTKQIKYCDNCGCKFSFDKEDIDIETKGAYYKGETKYIKCPQCGFKIVLSATRG